MEALDASHRLSVARYQEGLDGYLGALVAQRSLYGAQQGLLVTRLAYEANQITLYKALGTCPNQAADARQAGTAGTH